MQDELDLSRNDKWAIVKFNRFVLTLPMGWVDKDHKGAREEYNDAKWTLNVLFPT